MAIVYLIVVVPTATLVTTPELLMVAAPGLELLQVPPVMPLVLKADILPIHILVTPLITPADEGPLTVTALRDELVRPQLLETVYNIVSTPLPAPVTTPDEDTVAIALLVLLHTPPVVASVNETVAPSQIAPIAPIIVAGAAGGEVIVIDFAAE